MSQSKRHSAVETATNTAVGFVGSYFITFACFHIPGADLATKTLYATLGCTVWSLLRGYYLRRLFNHLHVKRMAASAGMEVSVGYHCEELKATVDHVAVIKKSGCRHLYVSGFGGMGDAVVCLKCGVDKYPESAPGFALAQALGRVIHPNHPNWVKYAELARAARKARQEHTPEE